MNDAAELREERYRIIACTAEKIEEFVDSIVKNNQVGFLIDGFTEIENHTIPEFVAISAATALKTIIHKLEKREFKVALIDIVEVDYRGEKQIIRGIRISI